MVYAKQKIWTILVIDLAVQSGIVLNWLAVDLVGWVLVRWLAGWVHPRLVHAPAG